MLCGGVSIEELNHLLVGRWLEGIPFRYEHLGVYRKAASRLCSEGELHCAYWQLFTALCLIYRAHYRQIFTCKYHTNK